MADGFKQIIGGLMMALLGFYGALHAQSTQTSWIDVTNPNNPCGSDIEKATYYQMIDNQCYAVFETSTTWTPPAGTIEYVLVGGGGGSGGGDEGCPMGGTPQTIDSTEKCTYEITNSSPGVTTTINPNQYGITSFDYLLIGGGGGTGGGTGTNVYPSPIDGQDGGSVLGTITVASGTTYTFLVGGGGGAGQHTWDTAGNPLGGAAGANGGTAGLNSISDSDAGPAGTGGRGGTTTLLTNGVITTSAIGGWGSWGGGGTNTQYASTPSSASGPLYNAYSGTYGKGGVYFYDRNGKAGIAVVRYAKKTITNRDAGSAGLIKGSFTGASQLTIVVGKGGAKGTWTSPGTGGESGYSSTSYGVGGDGNYTAGNPGGGGGGGASVIQSSAGIKVVAPGGAGGGVLATTVPIPPQYSTAPSPPFAGASGSNGGGGGGGGGGGTGGSSSTAATQGKYYVDSTSYVGEFGQANTLLSTYRSVYPTNLGSTRYGQTQTDANGNAGVAIFKYQASYDFRDIALATSNMYPIIQNVNLKDTPQINDIITIAVVGGSDPSDELTISTRNTPSYTVINSDDTTVLSSQTDYYKVNQYIVGSTTLQAMSLRGVMRLKIKAALTKDDLSNILKTIRLKTNGYRRHKIIAFLKGSSWKCYNASTISDNYRIECSQYSSSTPADTTNQDHGLIWRHKVLVSPNEGAAGNFSNVCNGYKDNSSRSTNTYETDQASTLTGLVTAGQVLNSATGTGNAPGSCDWELTTAGLEQQNDNKIHYRLHILRPNPILHAIPF